MFLSINNLTLQRKIPTPSPVSTSQLPATFTGAALSDEVAFSCPFSDFVGPAVVVDELPSEVVLASVSVGWAAFDPGRVHVGATVVSPWSNAFAVAQFPTLNDLADAPASSSSEQFT